MQSDKGASSSGHILVVGGGGHGRVVVAAIGKPVVAGILDAVHPSGSLADGIAVLGGDELLRSRSEPAHVAIGDNARRRAIVEEAGPRAWHTIISPFAIVIEEKEIGEGSFIGARAVVQPNVRIGRLVIINTGAIIEHDCGVGDFVHVGPGAVVCGGVSIGDDVFVGAGAVILPGVTVAQGATVGAGAVVRHDVPARATAVGNPARLLEPKPC